MSTIGYSPTNALELGDVFSPPDLTVSRSGILNGEPVKGSDTLIEPSADMEFVTSREQLRAKLGVDMESEAAFLKMFSAHSHFRLDSSFLFDSRTVNLVIQARADLSPWKWLRDKDEPFRDRRARDMVNDGQFVQFRRQFGSHYVLSMARRASIIIVLSVVNATSDLRATLEADTSVKGSLAALSGELAAKVSSEFALARSRGSLRLQILSSGAADFGHIGEVLEGLSLAGADFVTIRGKVKDLLATSAATLAAPSEISYDTMETFGCSPENLDDEDLRKELARIADQYREAAYYLGEAEKVRDKSAYWRSRTLSPSERAALVARIPTLEDDAKKLAHDHSTLLELWRSADAEALESFKPAPVARDVQAARLLEYELAPGIELSGPLAEGGGKMDNYVVPLVASGHVKFDYVQPGGLTKYFAETRIANPVPENVAGSHNGPMDLTFLDGSGVARNAIARWDGAYLFRISKSAEPTEVVESRTLQYSDWASSPMEAVLIGMGANRVGWAIRSGLG